jgi:thioester reductase-like protein
MSGRIGHNVFLTGATGFVGSEILKRMLSKHPQSRVTVLARTTARGTAAQRVDAIVQRMLGPEAARACSDRVEVVEGDISLPGLGLERDRHAELSARIDHVIHCAAVVDLQLPRDVARRHNTGGTRNVLSFVEGLRSLARLDYISTAYVAGKRVGRVREDELDVGQEYIDEYERTKMEAEALVQEFGRRFPTAIYRPSIVVGDSRTGEMSRFQGFHHALTLYRRLYRTGLVFRRSMFVLPADPDAIIDIVPIDYVVDGLFAMMQTDKSLGRVHHLTSGPGIAPRLDDLMTMTAAFTALPKPRYVTKNVWLHGLRPVMHSVVWGKRRPAMLAADRYFPFVWTKIHFDKTHTDALLIPAGITTPRPADYFVKLLEYQERALHALNHSAPG